MAHRVRRTLVAVSLLLLATTPTLAADLVAALRGAGLLVRPRTVTVTDFTLPALSGQPLRLGDYRGRIVLVIFWASWCPYCRATLPTLERLHRRYWARGVAVVGITLDRDARAAAAEARREGLTFPIGLDTQQAVTRSWQVYGTPTTFLIDPAGRLLGVANGAQDWDSPSVHTLLDLLLSDRATARRAEPAAVSTTLD